MVNGRVLRREHVEGKLGDALGVFEVRKGCEIPNLDHGEQIQSQLNDGRGRRDAETAHAPLHPLD